MKHKHEEYLAWIDEHVASIKGLIELDGESMGSGWVTEHKVIVRLFLANRDVLARHAPNIRYCLESGESSWDSEQELLDSFTEQELKESTPEIVEFMICDECGDLNTEIQENADEWSYQPEVYFPCPTYTDVTERLDEVMK